MITHFISPNAMTSVSQQTQFSFTKNQRLLKAHEFKQVFDAPIKKIHSEHLLVFVQTGTHSYPRLGLAITKKKVKLAVMRNRIKRLTREYFRLNAHRLAPIDVVLIVKKNYTKETDLHSELTQIFDKLTLLFAAEVSHHSL